MLLQLNVYPGLKGLKEMLGTVPAWIHYEERERVEVKCLPEGGLLTMWSTVNGSADPGSETSPCTSCSGSTAYWSRCGHSTIPPSARL